MKKMTKPTSKITTPNTSPLYKLLIVSFLAVLFVACDDDKDDNKPATYTVTFDTDGGTPEKLETQTIESGNQAQEPISKPTKPNAVFTGWINMATNQPYDFSTAVMADLILKAVYAKIYKVTFDPDGGMSEKLETQTIESGNQAQEPMSKPTKTGFDFNYWVNKAENGDQPYDFSTAVTADLMLKASYTLKTYKVRFDTDGGSTIVDAQISHGETVTAPRLPIKTGNFFAGWYSEDRFTNPYNFKAPVVADITLYAKWSSNNIPDNEFRYYLQIEIPSAFEKGQLNPDHQKVKELNIIDVADRRIVSLEGIQYFTGLTELSCSGNKLISLDVSAATALTTLYCRSNQLASLNVSANTALTTLDCSSNQLTSLDVSEATALTSLDCYENLLTSLEISKNTALTSLYCSFNKLTSLNVSANTDLTFLYCNDNQLSSLDISKNTALKELHCSSNQLSSLDVFTNTDLTFLYCNDNQLSSLNMWANKNLTNLSVSPNEKLERILVHESKLCDAGITDGRGVKGIFEANKGSLEMTITSYDDNGKEARVYDEAAYTAACK